MNISAGKGSLPCFCQLCQASERICLLPDSCHIILPHHAGSRRVYSIQGGTRQQRIMWPSRLLVGAGRQAVTRDHMGGRVRYRTLVPILIHKYDL